MATVTIIKYCVCHWSWSWLHSASFQACHGNIIGFEVAKAGYSHNLAVDFKLGLPSGNRPGDLRVSSPALFSTRCDTRRPTEQSHCGSVVLVVTELQQCSTMWINMNANNSRPKRETQLNLRWWQWRVLHYAILCLQSCTELAFRYGNGNAFRLWSGKQRQKKLAIYRAWPWISNCWVCDPNSGLSGLESSALTTQPLNHAA